MLADFKGEYFNSKDSTEEQCVGVVENIQRRISDEGYSGSRLSLVTRDEFGGMKNTYILQSLSWFWVQSRIKLKNRWLQSLMADETADLNGAMENSAESNLENARRYTAVISCLLCREKRFRVAVVGGGSA